MCVIASTNPRKVPINEQCFIKVGSLPWHWQAPLGPVVEIDCDLTKRLWAPDCTLAKVWLGEQGAKSQSGLHQHWRKSFMNLSVLFPPPPPLRSSISFHSLINHLPSASWSTFTQSLLSSSLLPPRLPRPSLIDVRVSLLFLFSSPCRRTVEVAPLGLLTCTDGSLQHFYYWGVFWRRIHLLLSVCP